MLSCWSGHNYELSGRGDVLLSQSNYDNLGLEAFRDYRSDRIQARGNAWKAWRLNINVTYFNLWLESSMTRLIAVHKNVQFKLLTPAPAPLG